MNQVTIVGAGTSRISGAPLIGNFKERAKQLQHDSRLPDSVQERFKEGVAQWEHSAPRATIEDYFVLADLKARLYGPIGARALDNLQEVIKWTLHLSTGDQGQPYHDAFAEAMQGWGKNGNSTVISLNWDVTHDAAFSRAGSLHYGTTAVRNSGWMPQDAEGTTQLLKLHGSLNWWECSKCECVTYRTGEEKETVFGGTSPPECANDCEGGTMSAAYIPPVSQKFDSAQQKPAFVDIWQQASRRIREAQEISIIGYSMPPTDVQLRMFLMDCVTRAEDLQEIRIVNPMGHGSRRISFQDRYADFVDQIPDGVQVIWQNDTYEGLLTTWKPELATV